MKPVDPTEITDILADPAEDELRALGAATAALGDRHAVVLGRHLDEISDPAAIAAAIAEGRAFTLPRGMRVEFRSEDCLDQADCGDDQPDGIDHQADQRGPTAAVMDHAAGEVDLPVHVVEPLAEAHHGRAETDQRETALMESERADRQRHTCDEQAFVPLIAVDDLTDAGHAPRLLSKATSIVEAEATSRRVGGVDRRCLTGPGEIVDRMARDILSARRDGQHGHLIDLTEFGWSQAQAMRWGTAAHEAARSPAFATQDAVERLKESDGAYAVSPFDVDRIAAAGEAAVAAALGETPDDFGGAAA